MIINGIINFLQLILSVITELLILNKVLGYSVRNNKTLSYIFGLTVIISVFSVSFLIKDYEISDLLQEILIIASLLVGPYVVLNKKKKSTFMLFGLVLCATMDFFVFGITSVFVNLSMLQSKIVYCIIFLIVLILAVLLIKFRVNNIPEDFLEQIPAVIYIVIYVADLATFYSITENYDSTYFSDVGNALMLISVISVVICISYVFFRYTISSKKQKETEQMLTMQLVHYETLASKNRDLRTFRHDYRNNLISIYSLVDKGKDDEALEYIKKLDSDLTSTQNAFSTGNYLADAILSDKQETANKNGIQFDFDGSIPHSGISNNDLCTVLSNLLDNAIRGCEGALPQIIKIRGKEGNSGFVLSVSNPVANPVEIKNNKIKTTKSDKENHGLGLEIIEKTSKKYNGYTQLSCEGSLFEVQVGFILKGEV